MTEIKGKVLDTCEGQFIRLKFKCYFRLAIIRQSMKSVFVVLSIVVCSSLRHDNPTDWDKLIGDSAQIMSARVFETSSESYGLGTVEILKGYGWDEFTVHSREVPIELLEGQTYLLFTENDARNVRLLSTPIPIGEIPSDLLTALNKLPCYVESERRNAACLRIGQPVCGCDGVTYGNPCEASNAGINLYIFGHCAKSRR
jgi:hypothetical protein